MTPQERTMLSDLIGRVESTRLPEKDAEEKNAETKTGAKSGCAVHPGADGAGAELRAGAGPGTDRTAEAPGCRLSGGAAASQDKAAFWGTCSGTRTNRGRSRNSARVCAAATAELPSCRTRGSTAVRAPPAILRQHARRRRRSSFLRSAATTAAGVAAGALAFEGIESLMHGFGHSAGFGGVGGAGLVISADGRKRR